MMVRSLRLGCRPARILGRAT